METIKTEVNCCWTVERLSVLHQLTQEPIEIDSYLDCFSCIWETKDIYIPGKKVWAVLLPCFVVKRLRSLAKFFKQVNSVSPIDLREFGEKIALSLDWDMYIYIYIYLV